MSRDIKIILTDIGGVIFKSKGIKKAVVKYLNEEEDSTKVKDIMNLFYSSFTKNVDEPEFWNQFSKIANIKKANPEEFFSKIEYEINYVYLDFLKTISNKYMIGIISDINKPMYNFIKMSIKNFDEIFNKKYIFLSYLLEDSKFKGQKNFFRRLKNNINIDSKSIVYIDDDQENTYNAICNGFIGLKYNNGNNEIMDNQEIIKKINNIIRY